MKIRFLNTVELMRVLKIAVQVSVKYNCPFVFNTLDGFSTSNIETLCSRLLDLWLMTWRIGEKRELGDKDWLVIDETIRLFKKFPMQYRKHAISVKDGVRMNKKKYPYWWKFREEFAKDLPPFSKNSVVRDVMEIM